MTCVLQLSVLCTLATSVVSLRVGAFNVKSFGPSKASKPVVMDILAKIAVRYDILLIQEIRDSKGQSIQKLQQKIKSNFGVDMSIELSDRLGRTTYKEQYAFLYRADKGISVRDTFHFDDGDESAGDDLFEREPFVVRFQTLKSEVRDFSLVALHTAPKSTVEELTALSQVVAYTEDKWSTSSIMILGDLNADCSYVPLKAWPGITLRQDSSFWWPIGDEVDTTVNSNTDCAYDRFIIKGKTLRDAVVPGSAKVFNFQDRFQLNADEASSVSDHYPVELELRDEDYSAKDIPPTSRANGPSTAIMDTLMAVWQGVRKRIHKHMPHFEL